MTSTPMASTLKIVLTRQHYKGSGGAFSRLHRYLHAGVFPFSLIEAKVILRQLLAMLRREPDLEDAWPEFSRNKQALSDRVVSDAV